MGIVLFFTGDAEKFIKNFSQILLRYTLPVVGNINMNFTAIYGGQDINIAEGRGEFNGVIQNIKK